MIWRNILIALAVAVLGGMVFADALPAQSTLVITDGTTPIASGTYVGGALSVNVVWDGTSEVSYDNATLTVTTRGGDTLTYTVDVSVDAGGNVTITLADGTPLEQINPSILARGQTPVYGTTTAYTAPTLPPPGPNGHANANAFEHAANATEGMGNASAHATAGNGGSHADAHAGEGSGNASH
ncbi:MAG TPA: hypothetical protein VKB31_06540 [Trueperaceae bacterium]|nr:hypothetical protein [Trueperaceae bacterium]